jgi:hypothetical protein
MPAAIGAIADIRVQEGVQHQAARDGEAHQRSGQAHHCVVKKRVNSPKSTMLMVTGISPIPYNSVTGKLAARTGVRTEDVAAALISV